jgi:hypothetical protein
MKQQTSCNKNMFLNMKISLQIYTVESHRARISLTRIQPYVARNTHKHKRGVSVNTDPPEYRW